MPIFEYSCTECGRRFEKLQKTIDSDMPICPGCGSLEIKREISTFSSSGSSAKGAACFTGGG